MFEVTSNAVITSFFATFLWGTCFFTEALIKSPVVAKGLFFDFFLIMLKHLTHFAPLLSKIGSQDPTMVIINTRTRQ